MCPRCEYFKKSPPPIYSDKLPFHWDGLKNHIVHLFVHSSSQIADIYYFTLCSLVLIITFISLLLIPYNPGQKHYQFPTVTGELAWEVRNGKPFASTLSWTRCKMGAWWRKNTVWLLSRSRRPGLEIEITPQALVERGHTQAHKIYQPRDIPSTSLAITTLRY